MILKKSKKNYYLKQNTSQKKKSVRLQKRGGRPPIDVDIILDKMFDWFWPSPKENKPEINVDKPAFWIPEETLKCIRRYNDLYTTGSNPVKDACYDMYTNWIIDLYFSYGKGWFSFYNFAKIIDGQTTSFRWYESSLIPFLHVFNNIFIQIFIKVLNLVSNRTAIDMRMIESKIVSKNPEINCFNNEYILFVFNKFGCANPSPGVLKLIQYLFSSDDSDCEIYKKDEYYKNLEDSIGKGGFGSVFSCKNPSKIIKFIESADLRVSGGSMYPGLDHIMVITRFLNEIIINLELSIVNDVLFKRLYSFGFKRTPNDILRMTIDVYENSSDPEMTPTNMPINAGRFYMVMDNMGITLGKKMKQNVDIGLKLNYLRNLVDGLLIMHEKGFCHLDIKENNILIGLDNIARFIDFGIANSVSNPFVKWSGSTEGWYPAVSSLYDLNGIQLLNIDIYHLGLVFYFILLDDGDLIEKVNTFFETNSKATPDMFYAYLDQFVMTRVDYAYAANEYNKILNFIKNNQMLDYDKLREDRGVRMREIRSNFYKKFPNPN